MACAFSGQIEVGEDQVLACAATNVLYVTCVTNEYFCVSADTGNHRPDTCLSGVQGDCSRALSWRIMGVPQQPLEQRSNDARGRPALPHHHRHDTGTQVSQCVSLFAVRNTLCDSWHVFVFADQQDCSHEALWNRYDYWAYCNILVFIWDPIWKQTYTLALKYFPFTISFKNRMGFRVTHCWRTIK